MDMPRATKTTATHTPDWADRLRSARVMTGMSQTEFARELGISQQRYGLYETGKTEPNIMCWVDISRKLDVSLDFLLKGDRPTRRSQAGE
jgi:DNA-binding XRE family transcriptional regulator